MKLCKTKVDCKKHKIVCLKKSINPIDHFFNDDTL